MSGRCILAFHPGHHGVGPSMLLLLGARIEQRFVWNVRQDGGHPTSWKFERMGLDPGPGIECDGLAVRLNFADDPCEGDALSRGCLADATNYEPPARRRTRWVVRVGQAF